MGTHERSPRRHAQRRYDDGHDERRYGGYEERHSRERDGRRGRHDDRYNRRADTHDRSDTRDSHDRYSGGGGGGGGGGGRRRRQQRTSAWDQAPAAAAAAAAAAAPAGDGATARQARRIYVGNVPAAVAEADVRRLFDGLLARDGLLAAGGSGVEAVHFERDKGAAYVELASAAQATRALALDGTALAGAALVVRRPHDFVAPLLAGGGGLLTSIPDGPNKVFLGGLPAHVSDQQVMELVSKYGRLRGFSIVRDGNGLCKGFGFLEFFDPSTTDEACRRLSGVRLGDKTLLARRSQKPHEAGGGGGGGGHRVPAGGPLPPPRLTTNTVDNLLNLSLPVATSLAAIRTPGAADDAEAPTRILVLLNAVSLADVKQERKHGEIVEDIGSECEQFGAVEAVVVPRPSASKPAKGVGRVFVVFRDVEAAVVAQKALAFRRFNHRCLLTSFFPEALWEAGELSGDPSAENAATVPDDQPPPPTYNSMPPPRHL